MVLRTKDLLLRPIALEHLRAYRRGREELSRVLGVEVPQGWPWAETEGILPWVERQLEEDPTRIGWLAWSFIHSAERILIGDGGFGGKPDAAGVVQMGYNILPGWQRRGYATQAVRALVDWAFGHGEVRAIEAETLHDGVASIRVLDKLGARRVGRTQETIRWQLPREYWHTTGRERNSRPADGE